MFRVIFHLDMDAFYASIEQRDNPSLRGRPVIVGSPPTRRGVVCAASYEARKFGVRSAMPSVTAGRLCPNGIFVRPRMERYKGESRETVKLVAETGAVIEQGSIDEAYLDLQDYAGDLQALTGSFGLRVKQFAHGEAHRPLHLGDEIKSISGEQTFYQDTDDRKILRVCLREQAADISAKLIRRHLGSHTIQ